LALIDLEKTVLGSCGFPEFSRPALRVLDGSYETPVAWDRLNGCRDQLEFAIQRTGRIEWNDRSMPYIGTGFLATPQLAITTRHVAEQISEGPNFQNRNLKSNLNVWINFRAEREGERGDDIAKLDDITKVKQVLFVHPYWDIGGLEVEPIRSGLSLEPEPIPAGTEIAAIGYPTLDLRNERALQEKIYGSAFGVKRLLPGKTLSSSQVNSFGRDVDCLCHDASTLGGTTGAPLIDLRTGRVVGIHFAGVYQRRNYAVPCWELLKDPIVRKLMGFNDPPWMDLWNTSISSEKEIVEDKSAATILDHPDLISTCQALGTYFIDDERLKSLFVGIPPEIQASWPSGTNAKEKLLNRLDHLNRRELKLGKLSQLEIVISNAIYLMGEVFPKQLKVLKSILMVVKQ
jgi:hypothetical protein